ncbi:MAG: oxygenase MpaB family protein [Polynucleobacter sp.]
MLDELIRKTIREMVGGGGPPVAFLTPKGDRGLFGPESIAWKVHADFISMMIGGISSLILQALHPQALAGVWDHSSFREDLKGRLGRTAFFIAATTYGSVEMANNIIEKVNQIHTKIAGFDEFGKPYSATDPHLLSWVHLTETRSFMRAYEDYRKEKISPQDKDQYFIEMGLLGERMGAKDLPSTYADTNEAIKSYIPELYFGERAQSILDLLENFPSNLSAKPFIKLISRAGVLNLPDWVYPLIQKPTPSYLERFAVKRSIELIAIPVREALKDGVAAHSLRRVYG